MIDISRYALPEDRAKQIAEEFRERVESEARAWDEVKRIRHQLIEERAKSRAYRFALKVYGWTGD